MKKNQEYGFCRHCGGLVEKTVKGNSKRHLSIVFPDQRCPGSGKPVVDVRSFKLKLSVADIVEINRMLRISCIMGRSESEALSTSLAVQIMQQLGITNQNNIGGRQ